MRRLFFSFAILAATGLCALPALAQTAPSADTLLAPPSDKMASPSADKFEDEFKAFRDKLQSAKTAISGASSEKEKSIAANPLGPAANLPLGGKGGSATVYGVGPQSPEDLQAMMALETAEQEKKIADQTFEAALKQLLPLQPEQVRRALEKFKISREAAETPITVPEPRQTVETISLDPSDAPAVIRLAPGYVTTVTILDATGAPWPIQDMNWAGKFDVAPPEEGGHVMRITPQSAHGVGNISIRLVDLITPITMRLQTGIEEVDYRFDARIPKPGPLAKTPIVEYGGLKTVAGQDDQMMGILEGTPPPGASKMKVKGVDGRTSAWKVSDTIYLRTPLTLLSPGWDSSVSSADGMSVYTMESAPVVLLSDQGRMLRAHISAADEVTP